MGLFDRFKKKENNPAPAAQGQDTGGAAIMVKYAEYLQVFISFHQNGNLAPIAAYENADGSLTGYLYINSNPTYTLLADEVVSKIANELGQRLSDNKILSYTIFYHSPFANDLNHVVAMDDADLRAISVYYQRKGHPVAFVGLPYELKEDSLNYKGFADFSRADNDRIFQTPLRQGHNYFAERENLDPPVTTNAAGIHITSSNSVSISDTWGGIFGFTWFREGNGGDVLKTHFVHALHEQPVHAANGTQLHLIDFGDVVFKAVQRSGKTFTILPVVKTGTVIDTETREINEWVHVDATEAIITGGGRDTFGIKYFVTDYAEHRQHYLEHKKVNVKLSGILFVLDIHHPDESSQEPSYSPDFAGYFPNKDLAHLGCFDFIGVLEAFRETTLLLDGSLKGYILTVRLINHPDIQDFFTIDMYVARENMRFSDLQVGMSITGMFQLQGCLAV